MNTLINTFKEYLYLRNIFNYKDNIEENVNEYFETWFLNTFQTIVYKLKVLFHNLHINSKSENIGVVSLWRNTLYSTSCRLVP